MNDGTDMLVFWTVVALRLLVPLIIPRFPLPAILACLVLDGVDQSIFQQFTSLNLDGYQSYDKALDVYYLSIAYISTMRNWTNSLSFQVARFLYFYRMVGVLAFELLGNRTLLLVFPNTFEYFFIFYEAARLRWNPRRMTRRVIYGGAAFIWIFIKLPQEYWIHVAQLDTTDFIKETIFGVDADDSWSTAFANRPLVLLATALVIAGLAYLAYWILMTKTPAPDPADVRKHLEADPLPDGIDTAAKRAQWRAETGRLWSSELFEQVALVSLVVVIFGQMLPGVEAEPLKLTFGATVLIVINSAFGLWAARRGATVESLFAAFAILTALDLGVVWVAAQVFNVKFDRTPAVIFVVLLTLIVALYNRHRPVLTYRRSHEMLTTPVHG